MVLLMIQTSTPSWWLLVFFRKVFEPWWLDLGPGRLGREWHSWSLITAGDLALLVVDGFDNDLYVLHPPKTNMKPRKMMVGRRSFPFELVPFQGFLGIWRIPPSGYHPVLFCLTCNDLQSSSLAVGHSRNLCDIWLRKSSKDSSQSEDDFQHAFFFEVFIFQSLCLLLSSHISENIADEIRPSLSSTISTEVHA